MLYPAVTQNIGKLHVLEQIATVILFVHLCSSSIRGSSIILRVLPFLRKASQSAETSAADA